MRREFLLTMAFLLSFGLTAQTQENVHQNLADKLLSNDSKLSIGGYAQLDYNQPFDEDV
jgi:hypothetical protein